MREITVTNAAGHTITAELITDAHHGTVVWFYDATYAGLDPLTPKGMRIACYTPNALLRRSRLIPLQLHLAVPIWALSPANLAAVTDWLHRELVPAAA